MNYDQYLFGYFHTFAHVSCVVILLHEVDMPQTDLSEGVLMDHWASKMVAGPCSLFLSRKMILWREREQHL